MGKMLAVGLTLVISFNFQCRLAQAWEGNDAIRRSVVKIYSIRRGYSLTSPWKRGASSNVSGSGVVISQDQILTNYHVVAATTDVSISLGGRSNRLSGIVESIAPGLDLAVIKLDEPLPEEVTPLEIAASTPRSGSKIQVFGYPKGGETLSITEGVISRIEYVGYKYHTMGLRTQIDAPLNHGNSGGPMIADGKVVGITYGGLQASNDIGYAIPCEEINIVLDDVRDGTYDGKARLWLYVQSLASKEMRRWLHVPAEMSGVKFSAMPIPVDDYPLKVNDVITQIGTHDVNNLGKVSFDDNTQVSYGYAVDQSAKEGKVSMKILRDGNAMDIEVPVFADGRYLLKQVLDTQPSYIVYGPLVLGVAVADFHSSMSMITARGGTVARSAVGLLGVMQQLENPYMLRRFDRVKTEDEQLVVITKLISNRMTRDIRVALPAVIRSINGQPVPNLRTAAEILGSLKDDLIVIEFDDNRNTAIVLDRNDVEKDHESIMESNGIVKSASKDLRDVWTK